MASVGEPEGNFRPAVNNFGFYIGSGIAAFDQFIARGRLPFTLKFKHEGDHHSLKPASESEKINYPEQATAWDI